NADAGLRLADCHAKQRHSSELHEILADIQCESGTAVEIIERMRNLGHKHELKLLLLDVNEVVQDVLRLVAVEARRCGVKLRVDLSPHLPLIEADRVALQQVMVNLIVNAMDAMDQIDPHDREVILRTCETEGGVQIAVSDI